MGIRGLGCCWGCLTLGRRDGHVFSPLLILDQCHSPTHRRAPGEVVYSKWYSNKDYETFTDVFKKFLEEAAATKGGAKAKVRVPLVPCLCA
jgi:hypothetical protein